MEMVERNQADSQDGVVRSSTPPVWVVSEEPAVGIEFVGARIATGMTKTTYHPLGPYPCDEIAS
jgi:hypothetical protein